MKRASDATPNKRLREMRELHGWSRSYIADRIRSDSNTVARWERGATFPSPFYRQQLCELFEMSPQDLELVQRDGKDPAQTHSDDIVRCNSIDTNKEQRSSEDDTVAQQNILPPSKVSYPILTYHTFLGSIILSATIAFVVSSFVSFFSWKLLLPPLVRATPLAISYTLSEGLWLTPINEQTVHSIVRFSVQVKTNISASHVVFRTRWNNGSWKEACTAYSPLTTNIFTCDAKLTAYKDQTGRVTVGFDIYQPGNVSRTPDGIRIITYSP